MGPVIPLSALTAAVNQETVRAVTGHKGGQQAGRQAGRQGPLKTEGLTLVAL